MRRTFVVGTAVVASLLWLSPRPATSQGAEAGETRPTSAANTAGAASAAGPTVEVDPAAIAAAVEERVDDRYGGYWVEGDAADALVHVNIVGATAADHQAAADLAGAPGRIAVHDVDRSYERLVAARDAVAASLDPGETGDFAVGLDVPRNGVTVETERGDAGVSLLAGSADVVEVATGVDIAVEPLGDTPTTFPPYEAGLHVSVASGTLVNHCTSGFAYSGAWGVFGTTAGHCGRDGDEVRVGDTAVGPIAGNTYQRATRVEADAALYSLSARRWAYEPVIHADGAHHPVVGALADSQIGDGLRLCFDGRTSGVGKCGTVRVAGEVVCCDGDGRSFVFSCITHDALAGDSGGPVYQPLDAGRVRAAGMLSSSVTVDDQRSMCFSTVQRVEAATDTRLITAGG